MCLSNLSLLPASNGGQESATGGQIEYLCDIQKVQGDLVTTGRLSKLLVDCRLPTDGASSNNVIWFPKLHLSTYRTRSIFVVLTSFICRFDGIYIVIWPWAQNLNQHRFISASSLEKRNKCDDAKFTFHWFQQIPHQRIRHQTRQEPRSVERCPCVTFNLHLVRDAFTLLWCLHRGIVHRTIRLSTVSQIQATQNWSCYQSVEMAVILR